MRACAGSRVPVVLSHEAPKATDRHLVLVEREGCNSAARRAAHRELSALHFGRRAAIVVGEQTAGIGGADTARPQALFTHQAVALLARALRRCRSVLAFEVRLH